MYPLGLKHETIVSNLNAVNLSTAWHSLAEVSSCCAFFAKQVLLEYLTLKKVISEKLIWKTSKKKDDDGRHLIFQVYARGDIW